MDQDEAVRSTNDDASICKRFAVHMGYWNDPYLPLLVRNTERKTPEINRGYFARVQGISNLIHKFITITKGQCQIVNFGAGFDTRFWNLRDQNLNVIKFVEIDFPNVTSRKCYYIKNNSKLLQGIHMEDEEVTFNSSELHSGIYHLVGADLRKLAEIEAKFSECQLNFNIPTLFLFECVLVYMSTASSHELLKLIASKFCTAFTINYEQVNMADRFGEVMLYNLKGRGCLLAGVEACASLKSQEDRFIQAGWDGAEAWAMTQVYRALPPSEIQRIEKIEFLDEKELLDQLFYHYCICVGWKDGHNLGLASIDLG
nr:EOG090X08O3 [Sida crystallina]